MLYVFFFIIILICMTCSDWSNPTNFEKSKTSDLHLPINIRHQGLEILLENRLPQNTPLRTKTFIASSCTGSTLKAIEVLEKHMNCQDPCSAKKGLNEKNY